jgi:Secretion system C-terminal sorting domain/PA14 domain/Polysaccharide deacetylase
MKKIYTSILLITMFGILKSQTPSANFSNWKDNRKSAYTIIHDDYGDVTTVGIAKYADTIAYNRGVKICFGAITSVCEDNDWRDAKRMITHGHECVNHSHNHYCAQPVTWCPSQVYTPANFGVELDTSTAQILRGTNVQPRFFIHPYDLSTDEVLNYLKNLGYLGARSGTQEALNTSTFTDPFRLNYHVFRPTSKLADLNSSVTSAISKGGFCLREVHGVADQSWASVSLANYKSHMDFVKGKILTNDVWSATISEVITYRMQRAAYSPVVSYNAATGTITVSFTNIKTIDPSVLRTPITLNVALNGVVGTFDATQNNTAVLFTEKQGVLTFNVYPHQGNIIIQKKQGGGIDTLPPCAADNLLTRQTWTNINLDNGWNINALKTDTRFPNTPTTVDSINKFSDGDRGDMYGERAYGYLVPTVTGAYTFTVTGDDDAELYLSTNDNAANKVKICGFTGYTDNNQFTKYAGQKSVSINLEAGKYYYVEALHIATVGSNHYGVFWQTPSNSIITAIGSANISRKNCTVAPLQALASVQKSMFLAQLSDSKTILSWAVQSRILKDYYLIEKANEVTGNFDKLTVINADNTRKDVEMLSFEDEKLIDGENFYRLTTVFMDGSSQVSEIQKVNYIKKNIFAVYPNPAIDAVSIDLIDAVGKKVDIAIFTLLGKLVKEELLENASAAPHQILLDEVENGQYFISIKVEGKREVMKKLMILK